MDSTIKENKITPEQFRKRLEMINSDIEKYWGIIRTENVIPIHGGVKRSYNLKKVLATIVETSEQRIVVKLDQMFANMGFTSRDDVPEKVLIGSVYPIIFKLFELRNMYENLKIVRTINPKLKVKYGKRSLNKTEEISAQYIKILRDRLLIEINAYRKKLDTYNELHIFDTSTTYSWQWKGLDKFYNIVSSTESMTSK